MNIIDCQEQYYNNLSVLSNKYDSVNGYDFYMDIFPNNECTGELNTDFSKPNAIYLYTDEVADNENAVYSRRIMLKDTFENDYVQYIECNTSTLCSGLAYRSKTNKLQNAQQMNALIFDIDNVGLKELGVLLSRFGTSCEYLRSLPMPTYVVLSGTGLHIYYVFDKPIDLYPNIKIQLKSLKHDLTFKMWEYKETSKEKQIQYQSINQGFRMVGSTNNKYDLEIKAFCTGDKVSLDYLNSYAIKKHNMVDVNKPFRPSQMTLAEAKESYPEWYQRVIVDKQKNTKKWAIGYRKKTDTKDYKLYEWWLNKVDEVQGGHRYFYLMCVVIYACKCEVPRERLEVDLQICFDVLKTINYTNPLTQSDIESALEVYDKEFFNFTIADIEKLTNIRIERNKRNYRKRVDHIKLMNYVRDEINQNTNWREGNGRPSGSGTAEQKVAEWRKNNPTGRKVDCIKDLELSKKTVYKWWG